MTTDVRFALRGMRRNPGFAVAAVLTLALGIAATSTVFTLINGALLRDLPFAESQRVVALGVRYIGAARQSNDGLSYLDLPDWQAASGTLEGVGAYDERTMNVADEEHAAERFLGAFISHNTFTILRTLPVLGRDFRADDEQAGAPPVAILGHKMWADRYGSDPNVIGRTVRVNGVTCVVVGVMPEGFGFPHSSDVWRPLSGLDAPSKDDRNARYLDGIGRLRAGVSREQLDAELRGMLTAQAAYYPADRGRVEPRVEPFRSGVGGPIVALMTAMMGAVGFVLLIACANVANLLLARAAGRAHEVSVRMSLGASRWRIVRQLLVESLVLALVSGVVALALSAASIQLFWATARNTGPPYWLQFPLDWRVFLFLAAVCLGTSVLFGLVPALYTARTNVVELLVDSSRSTAGSRRGRRWSGALVVAQVALTFVLLAAAGFMVRNIWRLATLDAGVDTASLVRLRLDLPSPAYDDNERRLAFYQRLDERLQAAPGMRASIANAVPLNGGARLEIEFAGRPPDTGPRPVATVVTIGPRYFDTLGTRPVRGRPFSSGDGEQDNHVAIVNDRFASMHFGTADPMGRRFRLVDSNSLPAADAAPQWMTIVGVAQDVAQRPMDDGSLDPVVYLPLAANVVWGVNVLVRAASPVGAIASEVREHVRAIDPDIPVFDVRTIDDLARYERWAQRVFGSMFAIFAAVALLLAMVGLYAVTAYSVAQRTREIGVRVALGATAKQLWWLVTRQASVQLVIGLVLGLGGALMTGRTLPAVLTRTTDTPSAILLLVTAFVVVVALLACLIPARRALAIEPAQALREG